VRIILEVPDLEPGRTKSHAVTKYVCAAIKVQALRREFATAVLEMRRCKEALCGRAHADSLMAEAEALCEELRIEPANR
jgi:hypothetical protein